jgi:hypothetical protein
MERPLADLSLQNTENLLHSVFGIYTTENTGNIVRKNISLVAPHIWQRGSDNVKYKLGVKLDGYKINLHEEKHKLGLERHPRYISPWDIHVQRFISLGRLN